MLCEKCGVHLQFIEQLVKSLIEWVFYFARYLDDLFDCLLVYSAFWEELVSGNLIWRKLFALANRFVFVQLTGVEDSVKKEIFVKNGSACKLSNIREKSHECANDLLDPDTSDETRFPDSVLVSLKLFSFIVNCCNRDEKHNLVDSKLYIA